MSDFSRRKFLRDAGAALTFSFIPIGIPRAAQVVSVRSYPSEEYSRVTIEHDAPMVFKYFVLRDAHPVRLVVDVQGLVLTDELRRNIQKVSPRDPYISQIRVGQYTPDTLRIAIECKTDIDPQIFRSKPNVLYKYRLMFDIYPAVDRDPIMAIIKKEGSGPDAIESLLAQVAEGQKRMEENRAESDRDQLEELLAGISDKTLAPARPDKNAALIPGMKEAPSGKVPRPPKDSTQVAGRDSQAGKAKVPSSAPKRSRSIVVMIDPGHGGEDPGAIGRKNRTKEKDVVLAIGRILRSELNRIPGCKAYLTRDADYFIPLHRRVQKARAVKADFFVSIHADAWIKPQARGSSLFALSDRGSVSSANNWLARNQNDADTIGGVNISDQDNQVQRLLMDMSFSAQVSDSLKYGEIILREISSVNTLHKERVEQANFAVLRAPDIPSVLVETAFLSNPEEEKKLRSRIFQKKVAYSIGNGIMKIFGFKDRLG